MDITFHVDMSVEHRSDSTAAPAVPVDFFAGFGAAGFGAAGFGAAGFGAGAACPHNKRAV